MVHSFEADKTSEVFGAIASTTLEKKLILIGHSASLDEICARKKKKKSIFFIENIMGLIFVKGNGKRLI